MNIFQRAKTLYILHRKAIKHHDWHAVTADIPVVDALSGVEKARLRELSTLFLHQKEIIGIDIEVTEKMRICIAAQACLPVLELGLSLFSAWMTVIVYPDAFVVDRDELDEYGVVHHNQRVLSGEAWSRGPVILSWHDIEQNLSRTQSGGNVIIHEIAHKLDMLNGNCNGMPPLHTNMPITAWTSALSQAYEHIQQNLDHHKPVCINAYAATNPAEFFAVISEYFFSSPEVLQTNFAHVYQQLSAYYRQDPLSRKLTHSGIH